MNMLTTIIPKSDQLNADSLIGAPKTIKITKVTVDPAAEQPVSIYYEDDPARPFKAGKSMRRVLVNVWGPDANAYVGRSMTLYRDEGVKFGGMEVGGIRISHMSHMEKPMTMALTATRGNKKPFTVKPLAAPSPVDKLAEATERLIARIETCPDAAAVFAVSDDGKIQAWRRDQLASTRPELEQRIVDALKAASSKFAAVHTSVDDEPAPDDMDEAGEAA